MSLLSNSQGIGGTHSELFDRYIVWSKVYRLKEAYFSYPLNPLAVHMTHVLDGVGGRGRDGL